MVRLNNSKEKISQYFILLISLSEIITITRKINCSLFQQQQPFYCRKQIHFHKNTQIIQIKQTQRKWYTVMVIAIYFPFQHDYQVLNQF